MNKKLSFNYSTMKFLSLSMKEELIGSVVVNCMPNNQQRFFLVFKKMQQENRLFFCFTPPFIRFHLCQMRVVIDHSVHPMKHLLKESVLKNIEILQDDRIIQFTFMSSTGILYLIGEFFSRHPNYYLTDEAKKILFAFHPTKDSHYILPARQQQILATSSIWNSHTEVERAFYEAEKQHEFEKQKNSVVHLIQLRMKKAQKKELELVENLNQCNQWQKLQHEGELMKCYFSSIRQGLSSIVVDDWLEGKPYVLLLDPTKAASEQMAKRFRQARKLEKGLIPIAGQLKKIQIELRELSLQLKQAEELLSTTEVESFKTQYFPLNPPHEGNCKKAEKPAIYREYQSENGTKIWIGKNAKANDILTFRMANGRDWWLHISGFPGSHVIIRLPKEAVPDEETLKDALQLALYYSKAREHKEGEVRFTQRKYVAKLGKKKAGLVQLSKHKTAWVRTDPARLSRLRGSLSSTTIILHL